MSKGHTDNLPDAFIINEHAFRDWCLNIAQRGVGELFFCFWLYL